MFMPAMAMMPSARVLALPLASLFIESRMSLIMLVLSRYLNPERNTYPKCKQEAELACIPIRFSLSRTRQTILSIQCAHVLNAGSRAASSALI